MWYFLLGLAGAAAFLVVLLLFDKDVEILLNRRIRDVRVMSAIYIIFGGIISMVANVASSPNFGPNQYLLAFGSGLGWPAIAAGIGAGKRVGEINEMRKESVERIREYAEELKERRTAQMDEYFDRQLERLKAEVPVGRESGTGGR